MGSMLDTARVDVPVLSNRPLELHLVYDTIES